MNFVLLDDVASHNHLMGQMLLDVCKSENIEAHIALEASGTRSASKRLPAGYKT